MPEFAASIAIRAAAHHQLLEVVDLLLKVATWAGITGDVPLADRCIHRAAEVIEASYARRRDDDRCTHQM